MQSKSYIYLLRLVAKYQTKENWTSETSEIISKHFNYLKSLRDNGQVVLAGKTDYDVDDLNNFGIVVFQTKSLMLAKELMENDPAIMHNVMTAELHPFSLALVSN